MKRVLSISFCMIALMAFAMWAPDASAFQFYSDATNDQGGCAQCHTSFRDNNNYISLAEAVPWNDSLHNVHLGGTTIFINCRHCHAGAGVSGYTVNIGSSGRAADGINAIACAGCHVPEGLRAHHAVNGITLCDGCHFNDPTPQPEHIAPPWYISATNTIVGINLAPCNICFEEQLAGLNIGLDNDGDNAYDTADPDCDCAHLGIPETDCNGVDDDCDCMIDEDYIPAPTTCGIGNCASTGQLECQGGVEVNACVPGTPEVEGPPGDPTCIDELDNDCDGTTDTGDPDCIQQRYPELSIPSQIPGVTDETVTVTVNFIGDGNSISTVIFSVDFDEGNLFFDPASTMGFPWPDAITVNPAISPFMFSVGITYDANDTDGELDFTFADINTPLTALPEGELVTITFTAGNPAVTTNAPVVFSLDPTASFGNTDGASVPGITSDGSVLITVQCDPTGTPETVCNGVDDDCDGSIDEDFASEATTCGDGECAAAGQTSCVDGVESDTCVPGEPTAEICDNLDNDCDGLIDEDLTRLTTCGVGECAATGEETCSAGAWGGDTCIPGPPDEPADVTCDGLDGDCDGSTDEDYIPRPIICDPGNPCSAGNQTCQCVNGFEDCPICLPGPPEPEVCDNLDNDCDGSIDEDLTRPTTCGVGECAGNTGEETCSAGAWGGDTCDPLAGAVFEVCDGLDNNCDGLIDETCQCTPGEIRLCGSDVGECAFGVETCNSVYQWSGTCVGDLGPSPEVCDNLDNDCDGLIDEDLTRPTTCGVGECAGNTGEETCTAGVWGNDTCDPFAGAVPEGPDNDPTCRDTLDNDCDGQTDLGDADCLHGDETNCFDGVDNDENGLTDCADPICEGVTDGSCSTGNACTTGTRTCQGGAEVCVATNVPDGTACGDPSSDQCDNPDSCLAGVCGPNFEPTTAACDDGLFCTAVDTCDGSGACTGGGSPCQPGEFCDEYDNVCFPLCGCITDSDCDDGLFCNGVETCDGCWCNAGVNPCQTDEICDEDQNTCTVAYFDLDIVKFTVSGSKDKKDKGKSKVGGSANVGKPVRRIQLVVENPDGGSEQAAPATLIGVQDGKEVYNESRMVFDLGSGAARFAFPSYTPVKKGTIVWTVEILDDNPDDDTATLTTRVK